MTTHPLLSCLRRAGLLAVAGLAACSTSGPADAPPHHQPDLAVLQAYHWDLADARDATGQVLAQWVPPRTLGNAPLRLTWSDGRIAVGGLCNHLMGSAHVADRRMTLGPIAGTMRHCGDDALMRYEQAVASWLPQVSGWTINAGSPAGAPPTLDMQFADGARWILRGEPTDETRYGGAGETRFLEVAPERVACNHPLMPDHRCLQVRDIHYDTAGIKTHTGAWQPYYGDIQRYQHQPGVRQVLRIKRYTLAHPPADGSRYVDVLDMVVETARATPAPR